MSSSHSKKSVIFHHPGPLAVNARSGSQVRPARILEAFYESGYDVVAVTGGGAQRKIQIKKLVEDISKGRRFDYVYSESRSIPTLLAEKNRLPRYPLLDFSFLRKIKSLGVPIGLFYRDVFWRFDFYKTMLSWPLRAITIPLYKYDWWWYKKLVDHLFLPSQAMAAHLPSVWPRERLSALPPGTIVSTALQDVKDDELLHLLYVGGITSPIYDISPLLRVIQRCKKVRLTVCCRQEEWQVMKDLYEPLLNSRVDVVHQQAEALARLYARADALILIRKPHSYLDFAAPVKIFEAIGYGRPVITSGDNEGARLVKELGIGWVIDDDHELEGLLERIVENSQLLADKSQAALRAAEKNTWMARVEQISDQLCRYRRSDISSA